MNSDYQAQEATNETGKETKEPALNRGESHLIELYGNGPIGIVECSLEGKYINVNEEFCRITGHTKEELLKLDIHDLTLPVDLERERGLYKELTSGGLPFYNIEQRYVRQNGTTTWVAIIRSLVREPSGEPLYTIGIAQDISHKKAVQEILRKSEATLQEKNIELEKLVQEGVTDLKVANLALAEAHKNMELLSQRLFDAQEDERRLIAHELHDGISQSLSALKLNLVIMSDEVLATTQQETDARLAASIALAAQVIDLVRSVMTDLRPAGLEEFGLEDALGSIVEQFHSRYRLNVQFERNEPPIPRLKPILEMALIRIAQEALFNIVKHANTKEATLILRQEENTIYLSIEDKGDGIKALGRARRSGSHGMTIMRERAEAFGGDFNVTSVPGQGTKIEVRVPLDAGKSDKTV